MDAVASRVAGRGVAVRCAFLELQAPDLSTAANELVAEGATRITIVPMFLGSGRHAREDLPRLTDELRGLHPSLEIELRQPVGENPRVLDLLAELCMA
jgi:sirohydrochlorin cobaltochelatase